MGKYELGQPVYVLDLYKHDDVMDVKIAKGKITSITQRLSYSTTFTDIVVDCKHEALKVDSAKVFASLAEALAALLDVLDEFKEVEE